ncbi:Protein CBG25778 [Caenorhabditis briggsae]|uniref:Protein CBG25778 n=1 Tax=Caenorhabditis briggsae TaxID=6238 RepID=B6IGK1_CAEBR|nr:Protein CBG25778 [Caenorhabditis briggsae]CAR99031.1 Protein CBG25778 [Caenorhabditis briggsae]
MSSGFKIWAQETSDVFHEEYKFLREFEIQNKQKSYWRYRISQEQKEIYNQKSRILKIEKKEREIWIPKNPKNPYEVWIQKNFEKIREKNLERNSEDVVRKLNEIWRKMTEEDKIPYIEEYEEIKEDQKEKSIKIRTLIVLLIIFQ